jgi:low affinity Fe/Cu permease
VTRPLPWYFSINDRPVKVVATKDGGVDAISIDVRTGEFVRDMQAFRKYYENDVGIEDLTEAEFEKLLKWHRDRAGYVGR